MRFLIDECLSIRTKPPMIAAGHDAMHVLDVELQGQPDDVVMAWCRSEDRILVTADTDFGELLWQSRDPFPSVILLRRHSRIPQEQAKIILANLYEIEGDLILGSLIVVTDNVVRVRRLPIPGRNE